MQQATRWKCGWSFCWECWAYMSAPNAASACGGKNGMSWQFCMLFSTNSSQHEKRDKLRVITFQSFCFTVWWTFCRLRYDLFVVFASALYPHYYGWWGMIGYINEEFHDQYWHQVQIAWNLTSQLPMKQHGMSWCTNLNVRAPRMVTSKMPPSQNRLSNLRKCLESNMPKKRKKLSAFRPTVWREGPCLCNTFHNLFNIPTIPPSFQWIAWNGKRLVPCFHPGVACLCDWFGRNIHLVLFSLRSHCILHLMEAHTPVFQIFFSATEAISTIMVLHLANKDNRMDASKLLLILVINLMHVLIAGTTVTFSSLWQSFRETKRMSSDKWWAL